MPLLFLLFIIVPIIEITVLINVGQWIGVLWTIVLVVLTAFIGINMLRIQGLATLSRANWRMRAGQLPAQEMVEGIFLAIGGALLLTPGFITDIFGFLLAMPGSRHFFAAQVSNHMKMRVVAPGMGPGTAGFGQGQSPFGQSPLDQRSRSHNSDGDVFEGEYTDHTTNDPDKRLK